jgi:hypothetical protein
MPALEMTVFRIVGLVVGGIGALATVFPGWFEPLIGAHTDDAYQAMERRVRGGMVRGVQRGPGAQRLSASLDETDGSATPGQRGDRVEPFQTRTIAQGMRT